MLLNKETKNMASRFDNGSINLSNTPNPTPPNVSTDVKLFQENGKLKTIGFDGVSKDLVPPQTLKVAQVAVNTTEDASEFIIRVPSPNGKLIALEATLRDLIATSQANSKAALEDTLATIASLRDSQELANGSFDSSIKDLENKVSLISDEVNSKANQTDVTNSLNAISSDLIKIVENINATLAIKATKGDLRVVESNLKKLIPTLPSPINIVAGSSNVDVTKENDTYTISVDIPKLSSQVIQSGGGVSSKKVQMMIDESLSGYTPGVSADLSAYTLLSTTAAISGDLQYQIDNISVGGVTIASSGGSIIVSQSGGDFNLEVASAPIQDHNSLQGLQGVGGDGGYYHLTENEYDHLILDTEVASISGGLVPYTGANANVDLGTHTITTDGVQFSLSPVSSGGVGQMHWDTTEKTVKLGLDTNVDIRLGQDLSIQVYNGTASTIGAGIPVYISTVANIFPAIIPSSASGAGNASYVDGITMESIPASGTGFVCQVGKIRNINTSAWNVGDQLFLGETVGTLTNQTSGFGYHSKVNPVGFVETKATNGEIFVTITNESTLLSLSQRETNIVLGNTISTGIYQFSGMTQATSASFNVPPTKGWIVENTGAYATQPYVINVVYGGGTFPVTNILTQPQTYVLIDRNNQIQQIPYFPTATQRRQMIFLGKIVHNNLSSINTINNTVDYDTSPFSAMRDMFAPMAILNGGVTISPNGANKSIARNAGTLYGLGINWTNDETAPNTVALSGQPLVTIRSYVTRSTLIASNQTLIDPANYDLNGTLTAVGGGSNESSNQRVYQFPNGNIIVQYGQTTYGNLAAAVAGIATESFVPYPNTVQSAVLIAYLSVVKTASNLSNTTHCIITPGGLFGQPTGGTSNISTGTLQQAYDNSITPEIVINATLDGFTLKNGTGNADNVTHLLEGMNTAGRVTSFIMADGTFHSAYSIVDSISGASGSIVTHDATGKLLDSGILATDLAYTSTVASISGNLQTQINTKQASDATLTALSAMTSAAGFLVQTAADTFTVRTFTATAPIVMTRGSGAAGNPLVSITDYISGTTVASISGGFNTRISTLETNTSGITGGLAQLDLRYADNDTNYVTLTGNQTISGQKTFTNSLVISAISGNGILLDTTAPSFGWRDITGQIIPDTAATAPNKNVFRGGTIGMYSFAAGDQCDIPFHSPHDWVPGSDIYAHVHWSHNGTSIAGNAVFTITATTAKGFNQSNFGAEKSQTITYNTTNIATTPQYRHRVDEIQLSNAGGTGNFLNTSDIEVDGLILLNLTMTTLPSIGGGSPNEIFIFQVDLHYQSTNLSTKNKSPSFYP